MIEAIAVLWAEGKSLSAIGEALGLTSSGWESEP